MFTSKSNSYATLYQPGYSDSDPDKIFCDWDELRALLLDQWQRLTPMEVDVAGPNRRQLAALVERKYGITASCVENYLRNFERTMPL